MKRVKMNLDDIIRSLESKFEDVSHHVPPYLSCGEARVGETTSYVRYVAIDAYIGEGIRDVLNIPRPT